MPPKKKGGKKGKKGKKSAGGDDRPKSGSDKGGSSSKEITELDREYFLIQVKDLEQRLKRYQTKCDSLTLASNETEKKYTQLVQDRKEVVAFLKKSLDQRADEIADLHDRLRGLQQEKDSEKESYEEQLTQLKREFQETKDQLTSENMILGGKLSSLEEFKIQKDDLMKKLDDMEQKLEEQDNSHVDKIYGLERKAVVDKDRLKKEMVLRVNTVAAEFRKVSNKQMADTTKRNIRENVSINSQLAKMSAKTKELVQENDDLRERERNYKMQVELLEATQDDLAKKNHSNLKVLKMVTARVRQQEVILEELEAKDQDYMQLEEESSSIRQENEQLVAKTEELEEKLQSTIDALQSTSLDRDNLQSAKERLEDVLSSASYTLQQVVTETPDDDPIDLTYKRQTMIERLLLVLNSAALIGKAPPPTEFFQQRPKTIMAPLSIVKAAPKVDSSRVEQPREFPHYKLGDLGLVPRPRKAPTRRPSFASKVAHLSQTTRIGVKPGLDLGHLTPTILQKHDKLPPVGQPAN